MSKTLLSQSNISPSGERKWRGLNITGKLQKAYKSNRRGPEFLSWGTIWKFTNRNRNMKFVNAEKCVECFHPEKAKLFAKCIKL